MTNTVDPGFNIDDVHRDVLGELFDENGLGGSAEERQAIAERWHQLDAWPDFAAALRRIRRHHTCVSFTILSLSAKIAGGNTARMYNLTGLRGRNAILALHSSARAEGIPRSSARTDSCDVLSCQFVVVTRQ